MSLMKVYKITKFLYSKAIVKWVRSWPTSWRKCLIATTERWWISRTHKELKDLLWLYTPVIPVLKEAEVGGLPQVCCQTDLHSQASQGFSVS